MKQNWNGKNRADHENSLLHIGKFIKSGFYPDDEIKDMCENEDQDENHFSIGIILDQQIGLNHLHHGEEPQSKIKEKDDLVYTVGHVLDHEIPIYREDSQSGLRVIPPKQSAMLKDRNKKPMLEKSIDGNSNTKRVPNHILAEMLKRDHRLSDIENNLYYWDQALGYHVGLVGDKADIFIRQNIPENLESHITFKSGEEIIQWIRADDQLKVSEEALAKRKEYVAFSNCVVKISDLSIHRHNPDYYFTSVVNTEYPIQSPGSGKVFEMFLQQVTGGNQKYYLRLQELFGYVISEIRDVKAIPFLLGPKDSGKSVVLRLLEHLVGQDFFTNLSFEELNQPNFLCQLFGKKLNACGEISEIPLNRLDVFKKLSGGDYVMARFLYSQAFKFVNKAVLLFAANHLPTIKGIDKSNAFSERLVIFPFPNQVPKEEQDIYLFDKLLKETPYIARWSLVGLRRWCRNNYQFTTCDEINELTREYCDQNNSVKSFVNTCCIFDPDLRTYNEILESAYIKYCRDNGIIEESSKAFHKCMQSIEGLKYSRFRMNDENKYGYTGIALCSTQMEER